MPVYGRRFSAMGERVKDFIHSKTTKHLVETEKINYCYHLIIEHISTLVCIYVYANNFTTIYPHLHSMKSKLYPNKKIMYFKVLILNMLTPKIKELYVENTFAVYQYCEQARLSVHTYRLDQLYVLGAIPSSSILRAHPRTTL